MRTLGDVLASRRRRSFVGRDAELEVVRTALGAPEPPFSVLWFVGPGGIGKSSLLDVVAELAEQADELTVARLDGRDVAPSSRAVLDALDAAIGLRWDGAALVAPQRRMVLLIDAYERLGALDDWVRSWLLPRLPAAALTVVAGRRPPGPEWRADPAWRESRAFLRVTGLVDRPEALLRPRIAGRVLRPPALTAG